MSVRLSNVMKRVILRDKQSGTLDAADTKEKLETFYATGALTKEEYLELLALVEPEQAAQVSGKEGKE